MPRKLRAFSLLELIMAVALLAVGILFIASLIPSSVLGLKKAEDTQAAAAYGIELIENARLSPPTAPDRREFRRTLNGTDFQFVRQIYGVDDELFDVVVIASGNPEYPPMRIATRVNATLGGTPSP